MLTGPGSSVAYWLVTNVALNASNCGAEETAHPRCRILLAEWAVDGTGHVPSSGARTAKATSSSLRPDSTPITAEETIDPDLG
jgi:hypothetical protein